MTPADVRLVCLRLQKGIIRYDSNSDVFEPILLVVKEIAMLLLTTNDIMIIPTFTLLEQSINAFVI